LDEEASDGDDLSGILKRLITLLLLLSIVLVVVLFSSSSSSKTVTVSLNVTRLDERGDRDDTDDDVPYNLLNVI